MMRARSARLSEKKKKKKTSPKQVEEEPVDNSDMIGEFDLDAVKLEELQMPTLLDEELEGLQLPPLPTLKRQKPFGSTILSDPCNIFEVDTDSLFTNPDIVDPAVYNLSPEADALLTTIKARVLTKPVKKRKPKRNKSSEEGGEKSAKKRKIRKVVPPWMKKGCTLDDFLPVLRIQDDTEMVYFDISDAEAPYDVHSTAMLRRFIQGARRFPSICSQFGQVCVLSDNVYYDIPLNGRGASRGTGQSQERAFAALDCFTALGCTNVQASTLKDLGFGSAKSRLFKSEWDLLQPTPNAESEAAVEVPGAILE